jgi:hypothetical protein
MLPVNFAGQPKMSTSALLRYLPNTEAAERAYIKAAELTSVDCRHSSQRIIEHSTQYRVFNQPIYLSETTCQAPGSHLRLAKYIKMPIDHSAIYVHKDQFNEVLAVYLEALKPLGYSKGPAFGPTVIGLECDELSVPGTDYKRSDFWIIGGDEKANYNTHLAFSAKGK